MEAVPWGTSSGQYESGVAAGKPPCALTPVEAVKQPYKKLMECEKA